MNDTKSKLVAAIAVKRKKMAQGGQVKSASNESRPMPTEMNNDKSEVSDNEAKHPLKQSQWTDNPTVTQARGGMRTTPVKHPKMVPSAGFSSKLRSQEDDLQATAKTGSPGAQPPKAYDEEDASKSGPSVPALKMKRMASGGEVAEDGGTAGSPTSRIDTGYGKVIIREANGGMINNVLSTKDAEEDNVQHPAGLESDNDQMKPSDSEIMSDHMQMLADGGMAHEMDDQPSEEAEIERHASIAAAIMAKRDAARQDAGSPTEDKATMMAEGGQVDLDMNSEEQPNKYYSRNQAILKENYDSDMEDVTQPKDSNETGDARESEQSDKKDMVSAIRSKMAAKRKS